MRDIDRALGIVSKFNSLLYDDDVYGNNGWGGTTMTKAKEDGKGRIPMR
jgi:hypothetical protein